MKTEARVPNVQNAFNPTTPLNATPYISELHDLPLVCHPLIFLAFMPPARIYVLISPLRSSPDPCRYLRE